MENTTTAISIVVCIIIIGRGDGSDDNFVSDNDWEGMESMSSSDEMGMLLNLDEGTFSVYKNGRKLGIMKRGLAGPYCWVASFQYSQVTIKRGTTPPS